MACLFHIQWMETPLVAVALIDIIEDYSVDNMTITKRVYNVLRINSLRPSDAYMRQKTRPSLVQIMACRLSEPMLKYC